VAVSNAGAVHEVTPPGSSLLAHGSEYEQVLCTPLGRREGLNRMLYYPVQDGTFIVVVSNSHFRNIYVCAMANIRRDYKILAISQKVIAIASYDFGEWASQ
jgi:hypothetical protein